MASGEFDKKKTRQPVKEPGVLSAEENLTFEAYLRHSLQDLEASSPKGTGVVLASDLGREPKLYNTGPLNKTSLVEHGNDPWDQRRHTDPSQRKRSGRLFSSVLSYLAIALLTGGLSGGVLLYLVLHYAAPQDGEAGRSSAAYKTQDRVGAEEPPVFNFASKGGPSFAGSVERSGDDTPGKAGRPPAAAANRKAAEGSASAFAPAVEDADARVNEKAALSGPDASADGAGTKMAALPPTAQPAPKSGSTTLLEQKPADSGNTDVSAARPGIVHPKLPADQEQKMLKRGAILLGESDIAGARLIFQYLAHHGSAGGAFALAETYDPKKWTGRHVAGMSPDGNLARVWYERAAELGSREAAALLRKEK